MRCRQSCGFFSARISPANSLVPTVARVVVWLVGPGREPCSAETGSCQPFEEVVAWASGPRKVTENAHGLAAEARDEWTVAGEAKQVRRAVRTLNEIKANANPPLRNQSASLSAAPWQSVGRIQRFWPASLFDSVDMPLHQGS